MSDRFVSPHPLPTPRQRELLTIFIEECAEAQQRATKLLRFGADEAQPGQNYTNSHRLSEEIGDILAMVALLQQAGLVLDDAYMLEQGRAKIAKVKRFLQSEPS